ncbi:MAG: T9SS type A sorting domain-containing protein [Gemmatimonadota bacterium]
MSTRCWHPPLQLLCVAVLCAPPSAAAQAVPIDFFAGVTFDEPVPTEFRTGDWVRLKGHTEDPEVYTIVFQFVPIGRDDPVWFAVPVADGRFEHRVTFRHDQAGRYGLELYVLSPNLLGGPSLRFFTIAIAEGSGPVLLPPEQLEVLFEPARFVPNVAVATAAAFPPLHVLAGPGAQSVRASVVEAQGTERSFLLRDDGLEGDEVAGDGVYVHPALPMPQAGLDLEELGSRGVSVQVIDRNGTVAYRWAECGVVDGPLADVREMAGGARRTERVVNLADPQLFSSSTRWPCGIDLAAVARRFYELFPDEYDFLQVRAGIAMSNGLHGQSVRVRNRVQGLGLPDTDESGDYGGPSSLQSVIFINFRLHGPLVHEVSHTWANYLELFESQFWGAHWGFSDVGGVLGDRGFEPLLRADGSYQISMTSASSYWGGEYSDLELYLMGLLPPEEVAPHVVLRRPEIVSFSDDGEFVVMDGYLDTVSVEEIIAAEGPRLPSAADAQRRFRLATVVVSPEPLDDLALTYVDRQMALFESDADHEFAFARATGYRAVMETRLEVGVTAVLDADGQALPGAVALVGAYPNPTNATAAIAYRLPAAAAVELTVFDLLGQPVRELVREHRLAGEHVTIWDARTDRGTPVASGIYLVRLRAAGATRTVKVTLAR